MSVEVENGFASLSDADLVKLRTLFRRLIDTVPPNALRAMIACLNEVDARLVARGILDPKTGRMRDVVAL